MMDYQSTNQQNFYSNISKARQDNGISKRINHGPMFSYGMKQYFASKCKTDGILNQNRNKRVMEQTGRNETFMNKPELVNLNEKQQVRKNACLKRRTQGSLIFNGRKRKCFGLQGNRTNHGSKFLAYSPPGSYFKREPCQENKSQSVNYRQNSKAQSVFNVPTVDDHSRDDTDFNLRKITPLPPYILSTFVRSQQPSTSPLCNNRVSLLNPGTRAALNTHNTMAESHMPHALNSERNVFDKFQHLTEMKDFSEPFKEEGFTQTLFPVAKNLNSFLPGSKPGFSQFECVKNKNSQNHENQKTPSNMKSCLKDCSSKSSKSCKVNFCEEVKVVQANGSESDIQLVDNKVYKRYKRMIFKEKASKPNNSATLDKTKESTIQTKYPMVDSTCNNSVQNQEQQKVGPDSKLDSSSVKSLSSNNSKEAENKTKIIGEEGLKYDVAKTISKMTANNAQNDSLDVAHVKAKRRQPKSEHTINLSKHMQEKEKVDQLTSKVNLMSKRSLGYSSIKDKSSTECEGKIDEMILIHRNPNKVNGENNSKGGSEFKSSIKTAPTLHSQHKVNDENTYLSCTKGTKINTGSDASNVNLKQKHQRERNENTAEKTGRQELAGSRRNLDEKNIKIALKQNSYNVGQSSEPYIERDQNTNSKYQNSENYTGNSKKNKESGSEVGVTEAHSKVIDCLSQIQQLSPVVTIGREHVIDNKGPTLQHEYTSLVKYSAGKNIEQRNEEQISEQIMCPGTLDFFLNGLSGNENQCSKCQRSIDHSVLIHVVTDDNMTENTEKYRSYKKVLNGPSDSLHKPNATSNINFEIDKEVAVNTTEDLYSTLTLPTMIAVQNSLESSSSHLKEFSKPTKLQLQKKNKNCESSSSSEGPSYKEDKSFEKYKKTVEASSGKNMYDPIEKCSLQKLASSETKSELQTKQNCNKAIENVPTEEEAHLNNAEKANMKKLPDSLYKEVIKTKVKRVDKTRRNKDDKADCHRANETKSKKEDIIKCGNEEPKSNKDKFSKDETRCDIADTVTGSNSHGNKYGKEDTVICKEENKSNNNKDQTKCITAGKYNYIKTDQTSSTDDEQRHHEKVKSMFCKPNKTSCISADLIKDDKDKVDHTSSTVRDKTPHERHTSKPYKPNTTKYSKADLGKNDKHLTNYLKEDTTSGKDICTKDGKTKCTSADKTKITKDSTRHEKDETSSCKLDKPNADETISNKETTNYSNKKSNSCKEDNTNCAIERESKYSTDTSMYDKYKTTYCKPDDTNNFQADKPLCTKPDEDKEVQADLKMCTELTATTFKRADKGKSTCGMAIGKEFNKADKSKVDSLLDVHPDLSTCKGKSRSESSSVHNEKSNTKHSQASKEKDVETPSFESRKQQARNQEVSLKRFQECWGSDLTDAISGKKRLVVKLTDILLDGHKLGSKTESTNRQKQKGVIECKSHDRQLREDEDIRDKTFKKTLIMDRKDAVLSIEASSAKRHDEKEKEESRRSKRTTATKEEIPVKKFRKDSDGKGQEKKGIKKESEGSECRSVLRQYVSRMSNVHDRHSLVLKIMCQGNESGIDEMVVKKRKISDKNDKPKYNAQKMVPDIKQATDYSHDGYKRDCAKKGESKRNSQLKSQVGKLKKTNISERKIPKKLSNIAVEEQITATEKVAKMSTELNVQQIRNRSGKMINCYASDSANKNYSSHSGSLNDSKSKSHHEEQDSTIINNGVLPTTANSDTDKTSENVKLKVNAIVKEMVKTTGKKNLSKAFQFICPACQKKFQTSADLRLHKKGSHPFLCHKCGLDFPDKASKTKHRWTHADTTFTCEQCKMKFGSEKTFRLHLGSMKHARVVAGLSGNGQRKKHDWQAAELSQAVASIQEPAVLDHAGFDRSLLSERAEDSILSPSDFGFDSVQKHMTLTEPRFLYADSNVSEGDVGSQTSSWTVFLTEPDVSVSFDDRLTNNFDNDYQLTEFGSSTLGLYSYAQVTNCVTDQSQSQVETQSTKLHSQLPIYSTINVADMQCEWESSSDSNLHQGDESYSRDTAYFPSFGKADGKGKLDDTSTYHLLQNMQYPAAVEHEITQVGTENIQKVMLPYVSQECNENQHIPASSHHESVEDGGYSQRKILLKAQDMGENFSKVNDKSVITKYNFDNGTQSETASCHMQVCDDFQRVS